MFSHSISYTILLCPTWSLTFSVIGVILVTFDYSYNSNHFFFCYASEDHFFWKNGVKLFTLIDGDQFEIQTIFEGE